MVQVQVIHKVKTQEVLLSAFNRTALRFDILHCGQTSAFWYKESWNFINEWKITKRRPVLLNADKRLRKSFKYGAFTGIRFTFYCIILYLYLTSFSIFRFTIQMTNIASPMMVNREETRSNITNSCCEIRYVGDSTGISFVLLTMKPSDHPISAPSTLRNKKTSTIFF